MALVFCVCKVLPIIILNDLRPNGSGSNRDLLIFQRLDHGAAGQLDFELKQNDEFLDNASLNSWRLLTMYRLGPIAATNLIDIHRVEAILGLQTLEEVLAAGEIEEVGSLQDVGNEVEFKLNQIKQLFICKWIWQVEWIWQAEISQKTCLRRLGEPLLKGIKEEVVLSPEHALSHIAAGEGQVQSLCVSEGSEVIKGVSIKAQQDQKIDNDLLAEARFCSDMELTEKEIERMVMEASRDEYIANDKFKHQLGQRESSTSEAEPLSSGGTRPSGSESKGKERPVLCSMQMVLSMGFSYVQSMEAYSIFGDDVDSIVSYLLETNSRRKGKATEYKVQFNVKAKKGTTSFVMFDRSGSTVKGMILDVVKKERLVDLSLKPELVNIYMENNDSRTPKKTICHIIPFNCCLYFAIQMRKRSTQKDLEVHLKNLKEMKLIRDVLVLIVRHMRDKVQNVIVSVCYMEAEHMENKHEEPTMEPGIEHDDKEYESDKQETSFDDNETEQHDNQITRNEKIRHLFVSLNKAYICFENILRSLFGKCKAYA
ncbi:OTU domain-containing protein 5-B-like protein isoform X1 [Tanacetum coccineum]